MRRLAAAVSAVTALSAVSACSTPTSQLTPVPAPSPSTSAEMSLTAPPVPNPLDTAKFEQNPCAVLSQAQAAQVANLTANRQINGNVAPMCIWTDADSNSVAIGFVPANGGLATVYKGQDNKSGYFEVSPNVGGYPAAFFGSADFRNSGGCQIAVGVHDDEVFTVNIDLQKSSPSYQDPCAISTKAAEAAVSTLKGGA